MNKYLLIGGKYINKSEDFIKWSESILTDFKRDFLKKNFKEKIFYYSETAIDWIEKNNAKLINGGQQWKPHSPKYKLKS